MENREHIINGSIVAGGVFLGFGIGAMLGRNWYNTVVQAYTRSGASREGQRLGRIEAIVLTEQATWAGGVLGIIAALLKNWLIDDAEGILENMDEIKMRTDGHFVPYMAVQDIDTKDMIDELSRALNTLEY